MMRSIFCVLLLAIVAGFTHALRVDNLYEQSSYMNVAGSLDTHDEVNGVECKACVFTVGKLEDFVTKNSTIAKIDDSVKKMCKEYLPSKSEECDAFLDMGIKYALHYIENNLSPEDLCKDAGMCSTSAAYDKKDLLNEEGSECDWCELVASKTKEFIGDKDAKTKVEKICEQSGSKKKHDECVAFIDKFFPIIQHLADHVSADEICASLHFCEKMDLSGLRSIIFGNKNSGSKVGCAVCELGMKEAKKKLSDKKIQEKIIDVLEKKCKTSFGESLGKECEKFVLEHGPKLLSDIANMISVELCSKAGLC